MAVDIGKPEFSSLKAVGQPFVIHSQKVEKGGIEVVHMHGRISDSISKIIRAAMHMAARMILDMESLILPCMCTTSMPPFYTF